MKIKTKSILTRSTDSIFVAEETTTANFKYDEEGDCIEIETFDADGELDEKLVKKYVDGNLVEAETFKLVEKGWDEKLKSVNKETYSYNRAGLLVKVIETKEPICTTYKYNEAGKLMEMKYSYAVKFGNFSTFDYKIIYQYDDRGIMLTEVKKKVNSKSHVEVLIAYKYDDKDRLVEKVEDDANRAVTKTIYHYDEQGKPIIIYTSGSFHGKIYIKYDDNGNEVERTHFDADDKIIKTTTSTYTFY